MSDRTVATAVTAGVRLFNRGRYLEAQETWEASWREAASEDRPFLEALIQVAGGLHLRLERGATRGAEHLLARALATLEDVEGVRHGVDVGRLRDEVGAYYEAVRAARGPHRLRDAVPVPKIR